MAIVAVCSHQADASSHRPRRKDNSCHSSLLYSCWLWWYLWVSRKSPAAASVSVTQGKTPGDCWTSEHVYKWAVPSAFTFTDVQQWTMTTDRQKSSNPDVLSAPELSGVSWKNVTFTTEGSYVVDKWCSSVTFFWWKQGDEITRSVSIKVLTIAVHVGLLCVSLLITAQCVFALGLTVWRHLTPRLSVILYVTD